VCTVSLPGVSGSNQGRLRTKERTVDNLPEEGGRVEGVRGGVKTRADTGTVWVKLMVEGKTRGKKRGVWCLVTPPGHG